MKLRKDIGFDEVYNSLFRVIITDTKTGKQIAHVFGETVDECDFNANFLIYKVNKNE